MFFSIHLSQVTLYLSTCIEYISFTQLGSTIFIEIMLPAATTVPYPTVILFSLQSLISKPYTNKSVQITNISTNYNNSILEFRYIFYHPNIHLRIINLLKHPLKSKQTNSLKPIRPSLSYTAILLFSLK